MPYVYVRGQEGNVSEETLDNGQHQVTVGESTLFFTIKGREIKFDLEKSRGLNDITIPMVDLEYPATRLRIGGINKIALSPHKIVSEGWLAANIGVESSPKRPPDQWASIRFREKR